jgi:glycosyltransferase involved in cell wall biosynthesis
VKVLLVSHGSGPYGAERVLLELARRLTERGHVVVLALPHDGPAVELAGALPGVTRRVCGRRRLPRTIGEGLSYFLGAPGDVLTVRRLVREVEPDVTWINSMYNPWAAIGARLARSPTVWHFHERSLRGPAGWVLATIAGWAVDQVVVVSEFVADTFRTFPWLRERLEVLHNPLLHEPARGLEAPSGPFTVGYVGQLEPRKRVVDLVTAIALLSGDIRGVLVGDGKGRKAVESAIRRSDVGDRIDLAGYREDVRAQMGRFHCLAMPSLEEPFGLAVLEAMARGLPVIAARSGEHAEAILARVRGTPCRGLEREASRP